MKTLSLFLTLFLFSLALVFAQSSGNEKREYKIISLAKTGNADPASLNEVQRLLGDGYQIKDLFYSGGLNVGFER